MSWPGCLELVVWDVGHGNATSVRLPNGHVIMLDCGSNPETGFSPVLETLRIWDRIDALFISHPHMDHISDIRNIAYHSLQYLVSPPVPTRQVLEGRHGPDWNTSAYYTAFRDSCWPIPFIPQEFFGNVGVHHFALGGPHRDMNAYSIVTFLQYGGFTFLYAGDLPTAYWPRLADAYGWQFTSLLSSTNFLEVSHHGRDEGYDAGAMAAMRRPLMGFVSDGGERSTSVTYKYDRHLWGWPACNEATWECKRKKVLTTRNDGRIHVSARPSMAGTEASVSFGGRHG